MDDIEEDKILRENINIYRKVEQNDKMSSTTDANENIPDEPTLAEMLDDLELNDTNDIEMKQESADIL